MISAAFGLRNPLIQLVGLPDSAKEQSYSVAAKPAPGFPELTRAENEKQVRLMVRAMLADRFHLKCHTEIRQDKVLNLEAAKGGMKLRAVDPPVPPEMTGRVSMAVGSSEGRMIGKKSTMADLAAALTVFLKQQVVDKTGSKDYYNIDVEWREPGQPDGPEAGFGPQGAALLVSVLREKLGIRLTSGTGPVEYLVVDHVEPPTDN